SAHMAATLAARGVDVPMAVVPTGVPLDVFAPGERIAARQRLGLPDRAPLCLYVGRLDREKSVERVLDAFAVVAGAISDSRLLLVGQGTHAAALRRYGANVAGDRVHFFPARPRETLTDFYRAADLFVFAS